MVRAPDIRCRPNPWHIAHIVQDPLKPLLTHLKIMRSNRSWEFGTVV